MALKLFVDLSGANSSKPPEILQRRKGLLIGIIVYIFRLIDRKISGSYWGVVI